ncbi:copper chaperone PCu(A)C [Permianibacter sp. IMCC34836]|uniref:copper chaperone PCu(A)C n=1 Tax=Permianibacter fluminis TaxID=2738515 RepID=UPI00155200A7|nr:copper chaperone PCu(A)C [Permianibacter fluminis]NQD36662.1 copper chaperone PCu(A)C [Permianibacter fluminis]
MRTLFSLLLITVLPVLAPPLLAAEATGITVQDGYVRLPPPGSPAAAYFTLKNAGAARALVDADCACAGMTMIHESAEKNGMATMRHVDSAPLPQGGELVLKPGGLHVMMMRLQTPLKLGDSVQLTLKFADGDTLAITLPVQAR